MHISKATIRKSEKYTHVDAVVDGTLQESFVIYSGTTFEHENAAWDYLIQCGVSVCDITDEGDDELFFEALEENFFITDEIFSDATGGHYNG